MVKAEKTLEFPGKKSQETYDLGAELAKQAGYTILKQRPNAFLLVCEGQLQNQRTSLNMNVPFIAPHTLSLNLQCDTLEDAAPLQTELERIAALAPGA